MVIRQCDMNIKQWQNDNVEKPEISAINVIEFQSVLINHRFISWYYN